VTCFVDKIVTAVDVYKFLICSVDRYEDAWKYNSCLTLLRRSSLSVWFSVRLLAFQFANVRRLLVVVVVLDREGSRAFN